MEKFKPRTPRSIQATNRMFFWSLIVTLVMFVVLVKLSRIKKNYTELHDRVNNIEAEVRKIKDKL